jgi:hypothetical protein
MTDDYAGLVAHLDDTETVTIVTTHADGRVVATPIWAVVVDGTPYLRAAFGPRTGWHRRALARGAAMSLGDGKLAERDAEAALADPRVPVTVTPIDASDPVQDAVSAAYEAKYLPLAPAHVAPVVDEVSRTVTIALLPA